jgi:hypothetical protein
MSMRAARDLILVICAVMIRTSAWRNQNPAISPKISSLILKKQRSSAYCPVNGLAFISEWTTIIFPVPPVPGDLDWRQPAPN